MFSLNLSHLLVEFTIELFNKKSGASIIKTIIFAL